MIGLWRERLGRALPGRMLRAVTHPSDVTSVAVPAAAAVAVLAAYFALTRGHPPLHPSPGWDGPWYLARPPSLVVSMLAYVVATCYLYRAAVALTSSTAAGIIAAAAFAASPAVPALRAVPMDGLLLAACSAAVSYHLTLWWRSGTYRQLSATSIAALLAALASGAGWALDAAAALLVWYVAWRYAPWRHAQPGHRPDFPERLRHAEAHLLFYAVPALTPVAGWLAWNWAEKGSPLHFAGGAATAGLGTIPGAATVTDALVLPALLMGYLAVASARGGATGPASL
jgi:hypothetical protein